MADGRAAALGVCFSALLTTDFEPGLEAMVEGRATVEGLHCVHLWAWRGGGGGVCLSAPLAADFRLGTEALAEGRAAGLGVCFSAPLAVDFGPVA